MVVTLSLFVAGIALLSGAGPLAESVEKKRHINKEGKRADNEEGQFGKLTLHGSGTKVNVKSFLRELKNDSYLSLRAEHGEIHGDTGVQYSGQRGAFIRSFVVHSDDKDTFNEKLEKLERRWDITRT